MTNNINKKNTAEEKYETSINTITFAFMTNTFVSVVRSFRISIPTTQVHLFSPMIILLLFNLYYFLT